MLSYQPTLYQPSVTLAVNADVETLRTKGLPITIRKPTGLNGNLMNPTVSLRLLLMLHLYLLEGLLD